MKLITIKHLLFTIFAMAFLLCGFGLGFAQASAEEEIKLLYDDRKELSALVDAQGEVTISDERVTSYKVGTTTADDHVLLYQDGVLYAVGTGTATLTVGEKSYNVTVAPAPISLFMITGHSGGAGQEGNGSQSVVVEAGQAYSSYHQNSLDVTEVDGYGLGWGSEKRVGGEEGLVRKGWDSYGHIDAFAPGMGGCTGCTSGLAYRWNQLTGEKIWLINIAIGGSCINEWLPGTQGHNTAYDRDYYNQTISKFTYAQTILKNEAAAGHYTLSKQGIINYGGSNFSWYNNWSMESIQQDYETLWNAYQQELFNIDIDGDGKPDGLDMLAFVASFSSRNHGGDRPALWYMNTSGAFSQNVGLSELIFYCNTVENIQKYFPEIDYTTQSIPVKMPDSVQHINFGGTSEDSIFCATDGVHLSQVANNAQGLEIGENLYKWFFVDNQNTVAESIRFEDRSYNIVPDTVNISVGQSYVMTPRPTPITVNDLTYEVTGAAELTYPLSVKGTSVGTATLTVKQGDRVLKTMTFNVSAAHTHCECGGTLTGAAKEKHTCGEELTYVPLTKECFTNWRYTTSSGGTNYTSNALRSGNYYLTGDYTHSGVIYVAPGATVNICLNGYKLTTTDRSFSPNGSLNICDCCGTGQVYSKRAGTSPILYSNSGSVVNIYGGTFSSVAPEGREFAGCFTSGNDLGLQNCDLDGDGVVENATKGTSVVSIWGGKFIGSDLDCNDGSPTAMGAGCCAYVVSSKCTLNIYGGELIGGKPLAPEDGGTGGGGVIATGGGPVNIYGGTFKGSRDSQGAIWTNNSNVHISGSPVFEDNLNAEVFLYYCDHLYINGLNVQTPIRVTGTNVSYTKVHLTSAEEKAMVVGAEGYTMTEPDSNLIMKFAKDRTYCECGGTLSEEMKTLSGHVCKDATWSALYQKNFSTVFTTTSTTPSQTSTARYYLKNKEVWLYLTGNVNLTNEIEISEGYTLHLDLNGYTIAHCAGSASLFRVHGNLTICDSRGGGKAVGVRTGTSSAEAACVYVQNYNSYAKTLCKPSFHFYSGTLTAFNITSAADRTRVVSNQAGVVQIGNNNGNRDALFNMYGGTIENGVAAVAGNVLLAYGTMNMYDGVISGGTAATSYGGNLRVSSGNTFTMYGGTIKNGTATENNGGNAYISSGTNRILGGTIENGWAKNHGGNIYLTGGELEITGAKISGGCAFQGGNVFIYGGTANISGTELRDGAAGYVFSRNADGTMNISATDAPGGNAGHVYVGSATANLTNVTMVNGFSIGKNGVNGLGGHIYNKGTLVMDGCTATGSTCNRGGVVGIRDNGSQGASYTEIKNSAFSGNSANVAGSSVGGWFDTNGAQIVIENCSFDDAADAAVTVISANNSAANKNPVSLKLKDVTIKSENKEASCVVYSNFGTVTLEGDMKVTAAVSALYLSDSARLVADDFAPAEPISIGTPIKGTFGTSATDKSMYFVNATKGVNWADGNLYFNGLLRGTKGTYKTFADAMAAGEGYLTLLADYEGNAEVSGELYLDLNGKTLTGNITGSGTLYGMDSATDEYTAGGRITGTVSCKLEMQFKTGITGSVRRYMAVADDTGYTFNRFYIGITHLNLKPGAYGVGYKATIAGNDAVLGQIKSYGYKLWVTEDKVAMATRQGAPAENMLSLTARLQNFDVDQYGETPVNGSVYIELQDGTVVESSVTTFTLRDMLETIAANAGTYSEDQVSAVKDMVSRFADAMANWNIDNLR